MRAAPLFSRHCDRAVSMVAGRPLRMAVCPLLRRGGGRCPLRVPRITRRAPAACAAEAQDSPCGARRALHAYGRVMPAAGARSPPVHATVAYRSGSVHGVKTADALPAEGVVRSSRKPALPTRRPIAHMRRKARALPTDACPRSGNAPHKSWFSVHIGQLPYTVDHMNI